MAETIPWNDGKVHQIQSSTIERGVRKVWVRCGLELRLDSKEALWGASGFASRVTCPACRVPPGS